MELLDYLNKMGPLQTIGVLGFVFYITAFGSVQFGVLDGNSVAYTCLNILAASLVAISLFAEFNLSSALIQASWILIGLGGLLRHFWRTVFRASKVTLTEQVRGAS